MSNFLSPIIKGSVDDAIEAIRQSRDEFLSTLLSDAGLASFLEEHLDTIYLSPIRTEFLKRDLKELRSSVLDLPYYSPLIKELKEQQVTSLKNHRLFIEEAKLLYEKYRY